MKVSFQAALPTLADPGVLRPCFLLTHGVPALDDPLGARLRQIPGHRRAAGQGFDIGGKIVLPPHPLAAARLLHLLPPGTPGVEWNDGALAYARVLAARPGRKHQILNVEGFVPLPQIGARTLRPYQARAVAAIKDLGWRALLADEMGLGKTATAIAAWMLWGTAADAPPGRRLLVVCPVSVKWNWRRELMASGVPEEDIVVIDGPRGRRADLFTQVPSARVCIINYDLFPWLADPQKKALRSFAKEAMLCLDESHYIKDRTAKRTVFAQSLEAPAVICMTGTPIYNTSSDLYTQITMLADVWSNWFEFQDSYLIMGEMNLPGGKRKKIVVGTKNEQKLNEIVDCYQIRRLKSEVGGLPPKVHTRHELDMDTHTAAIYEAMRKFWIFQFADMPDDESIWTPRAQSALEQSLRCEQIAQGFVGGLPEEIVEETARALRDSGAVSIPGRGRELVFPQATKLRWTVERIADLRKLGRPAVVWSRFNGPLFWLHRQLGDFKPVVLHGGLTGAQKDAVIQGFQGGDYGVLLGQIKMAQGFNLMRATDVIRFGSDWAPAVNLQAEDRCHRIGVKGTVNVEIPIMRGTCEEYLHARLDQKEGSAAVILNTMRDLKGMLGLASDRKPLSDSGLPNKEQAKHE